jgi:L-asparagine transporter-like permease
MIFVTHLMFRRRHTDHADHTNEAPAFRMWGYPWTSLAGAGLLLALLATTSFTREFRMTLVCGVPFLLLLTAVFRLRFRPAPVSQPTVPQPSVEAVS